MEWTGEKDVFMLREIFGSNVFALKKGSPARGLAWESLVSTLNEWSLKSFNFKTKEQWERDGCY